MTEINKQNQIYQIMPKRDNWGDEEGRTVLRVGSIGFSCFYFWLCLIYFLNFFLKTFIFKVNIGWLVEHKASYQEESRQRD